MALNFKPFPSFITGLQTTAAPLTREQRAILLALCATGPHSQKRQVSRLLTRIWEGRVTSSGIPVSVSQELSRSHFSENSVLHNGGLKSMRIQLTPI